MTKNAIIRTGAVVSILSAGLITAGFVSLGITFGYPDIIREGTSVLLTKLYEQRELVPFLYYILALGAGLLVFSSFFLKKILEDYKNVFAELGQICGIIAGILFCTGILRYFTLFPLLAQYMKDGTDFQIIDTVFNAFQIYTGQTITEHVMFAFLSLMTLFFSIAFIQTKFIFKWISYFGILSGIMLFYGNLELFGLPLTFAINRVAADMCGGWLLMVGVVLLFKRSQPVKQ